MKHLFTQFFLIFAVVFSLLAMPACDRDKAQKTVRDFKVKSAELSTYGTRLITAFGDAYRAGEITQDQLRTINKGTGTFVQAIGVYRTAISQAEAIVNSGQPLPANTLQSLNVILNDQVIAAFFEILVSIGALPIAKSEVIKTVIAAIRLTILAIQGAFSDARDLLKTAEVNQAWT